MKHLNMWKTRLRNLLPFMAKPKQNNHVISLSDDGKEDEKCCEFYVRKYRPESLDSLCRQTKFSAKELKLMYSGFKQQCPSGYVTENTFKEIYAQFFPQGDCDQYARYVFAVFDQHQNGIVTFEEFVKTVSVLARGDTVEKLSWIFNLYDTNKDGLITKQDLLSIGNAVESLMGSRSTKKKRSLRNFSANDECRYHDDDDNDDEDDEASVETMRYMETCFKKLHLNANSSITITEFIDACLKDTNLSSSLQCFDTVLI